MPAMRQCAAMRTIERGTDRRATPDRRDEAQRDGATELLAALDRREIEIVFQPQFAAASGQLTGAEALVRWQHPERGRIGAGALLALAQRGRQRMALSRHIMRTALAVAAKWPAGLRLSLNITAADLATAGFPDMVAAALGESAFDPERLTLEITEETLIAEIDRSVECLTLLADLGVHIALDDFGAGFCNFGYLKRLPLHYLKLDRSMVEGIDESPRDLAVLRGILSMAHALNLEVIAEGVERETQRVVIAREGCSAWQGFLGARPMSPGKFADLAPLSVCSNCSAD
jgi:EAL domain-containing protein (putative c-di-GMP-specific phosphodiesterase class I)